MYIIAYATQDRKTNLTKDKWVTAETLSKAQDVYRGLLAKHNLHSASIAAVVKSTDYSPEK